MSTRPHVGAYQLAMTDAQKDHKRHYSGSLAADYEAGWREGRACKLLKAKGLRVPGGVGNATKEAVRLGLLGA